MRIRLWVAPASFAAVGLIIGAVWPSHRGPSPQGCDTSGVPDACSAGAQTIHHYLMWTLVGLLTGIALSLLISWSRRRKRVE
jgi:hypothetical protein